MTTSSSWLLAEARRTSRNRCIVAALVLACVAGWLGAQAPYLREFFRGPTTVTAQHLDTLSPTNAKAPHWVRLRAEEMLDTGIEEITVRKKRGVETGRSVSGHYFAARLGEQFVLVKAHGDSAPGKELVGEVRPLPTDVAQRLFAHPNAQKLRPHFMPLLLDLHDFRTEGWWMLGLAGVLVLAAGGWGLVALGRMQNPQIHPTIARASQWGRLHAVTRILDQELRAPDTQKIGGWTLTANHLLRKQWLNLDLYNLNELLWAHPQVTKKKLYYVIPAGETHALVLKWRDASITLQGKEDAVATAFAHIATHQPWILLGWNEGYEKLYGRQRMQMARDVQKNRQRWQAAQAGMQARASA